MPFMKGFAPVRRTIDYLTKSKLILKPYVRILAIHYNRKQESHQEVKDFVFWHLPHLQYKNPDVQVLTIRELTPTPFIRVWLESGRDLVLDVDRQSKDEIHDRILRCLCKTSEDLKAEQTETEIQENPANFGRECRRHCMCEIPGQVPCPNIVPLPYMWRGKYKFGHAELDESKYFYNLCTDIMWCCSCASTKGFLDAILGFHETEAVSGGSSNAGSSRTRSNTPKTPDIFIDSTFLGHEVVVVKNGLRVCGTGGALGSQPLIQTKSYFEVKLQQDGVWGMGVATRNTLLENGPFGNDTESWIMRQTGEFFHNKMKIGKIESKFQEGDIFGISYDHIELSFYINGIKSNISFSNVRGTVFPALFVDEGAVLDVIFDGFTFPPPTGFERIIKEKTIL